jgi:hypothetical protein
MFNTIAVRIDRSYDSVEKYRKSKCQIVSDEDVYYCTKGCWSLNKGKKKIDPNDKKNLIKYVLAIYQGKAIKSYKVEKWYNAPMVIPPEMEWRTIDTKTFNPIEESNPDRWCFDGEEIDFDHPVNPVIILD